MSANYKKLFLILCVFVALLFVKCKDTDECCEPEKFEFTQSTQFDYPFTSKLTPEDYTERVGSMMDVARVTMKKVCNGSCKKDEVCIPVMEEAIASVWEDDWIDTIMPGKTMVCTLTVKGRCVCVKRGEEGKEPCCGPPSIEVRTWEEEGIPLDKQFTEDDYKALREIVTERAQGAAVGLCAGGCERGFVCSPEISHRTYKYTTWVFQSGSTDLGWKFLKCAIQATGSCVCKKQ